MLSYRVKHYLYFICIFWRQILPILVLSFPSTTDSHLLCVMIGILESHFAITYFGTHRISALLVNMRCHDSITLTDWSLSQQFHTYHCTYILFATLAINDSNNNSKHFYEKEHKNTFAEEITPP